VEKLQSGDDWRRYLISRPGCMSLVGSY